MGLYDAIKDGIQVAQKADNIEVMKKLLDAQREALDLFEDNRRLKERVAELSRQQDVSERLRFDGKRYWLRMPDSKEDGPYCSTCWDVDRRLVREMITRDKEPDGTSFTFCVYCRRARR